MTHLHDPMFTLDEAGDLLGTGPDLPRRLVESGCLDHTGHGDDVRVPQSALIAYVIAQDAGPAAVSATVSERDAA